MGKKSYKYMSFDFKSKDSQKKKKKSKYDEPKVKTLNSTLDKSDRKDMEKMILTPIEVPKKFTKIRNRCNHVGSVMSVADFKRITPMYSVYTPMLDAMIQQYGEENLTVCASCFEVKVAPKMIQVKNLKSAITDLYAAATFVQSTLRKKDEIEELSKMKKDLGDWNGVINTVSEMESSGLTEDAFEKEEDLASKLNNISSGHVY